jgi:hypothetical protein
VSTHRASEIISITIIIIIINIIIVTSMTGSVWQ